MKVIVGSVHVAERQREWEPLQRIFLDLTTPDHHLYITHAIDHTAGLNALVRIFKKHTDADAFLLLDSDAFPITPHWPVRLGAAMAAQGHTAAAPYRIEALDLFAHPSFFFFLPQHLRRLEFKMTRFTNMLSRPIYDPMGNIPCEQIYPLLRCNYRNPHPIAAAIYGGGGGQWCYHNGCGSRNVNWRAMNSNYYRSYDNEEVLTDELMKNPEKFIDHLCGASMFERRNDPFGCVEE